MTRLVPLRIPSTWAVIYNAFGDEDPVVRDGAITNFGSFGEDLLSIERLQFNGADWVTVPDGYILDLGWYPDADPAGQYRLTLIRGDWDHVVGRFASRNRGEIRAAVERCLEWVSSDTGDEEIARLMAGSRSSPPSGDGSELAP